MNTKGNEREKSSNLERLPLVKVEDWVSLPIQKAVECLAALDSIAKDDNLLGVRHFQEFDEVILVPSENGEL